MSLTQKSANRKDIRTGKSDMQHRHFTTIAAIIRSFPDVNIARVMTDHFADELQSTNPKFDPARFVAACTHGR